MAVGVSGTSYFIVINAVGINVSNIIIFWFFIVRYIETGTHQGALRTLVIPQLQKILGVPADQLVLYQVYTPQDSALFREQNDLLKNLETPGTGQLIFRRKCQLYAERRKCFTDCLFYFSSWEGVHQASVQL